jgi:hypothetical protein
VWLKPIFHDRDRDQSEAYCAASQQHILLFIISDKKCHLQVCKMSPLVWGKSSGFVVVE